MDLALALAMAMAMAMALALALAMAMALALAMAMDRLDGSAAWCRPFSLVFWGFIEGMTMAVSYASRLYNF